MTFIKRYRKEKVALRTTLRAVKFTALLFALSACSGGSSSAPTPNCSSSMTSTPAAQTETSTTNVVSVTVDGTTCSTSTQYVNEPCVNVTICQAGSSTNCQTIGNVLLDTGSFGLRVFSSLVTVPLTSTVACSDSGTMAECVGYGDGSSDWGQVVYANVQLGGEQAVTMPIQLINSNYSTPPGPCSSSQSTPDTSPQEAGFNGILGVGTETQDCGSLCVTGTDAQLYYSCTGSNCTPATVPLNTQVSNPVSLLPSDNNGVMLQLGSVPDAGAVSVTGSLYLGIGTQSNNQPPTSPAPSVFSATYDGDTGDDEISTIFSAYSSTAVISFFDSGSNMFFIPPPTAGQLPDCSVSYGPSYAGFYCPTTEQPFSATNQSAPSASVTGAVSFNVANAYPELQSSNYVFNNIAGNGGTGSDAEFDWGLPFFLNRSVYVGITGTTSTLGTGPYWAY